MIKRTTLRKAPEDLSGIRRDPPGTAELLARVLTGGNGGDSVVDGIDNAIADLDLLYDALDDKGDVCLAGHVHQVQTRLAVIAELVRASRSRKPT